MAQQDYGIKESHGVKQRLTTGDKRVLVREPPLRKRSGLPRNSKLKTFTAEELNQKNAIIPQ